MARKKSDEFTDVELEIMRVLWENGPSSSDDIRQSLPGEEKRKDSTVRTLLGIMEKKGYVEHVTVGRTYHYRALVKRDTARKRSVQRLLERVFDGSPKMLLQSLLDTGELDSGTVSEIQDMLQSLRDR